jgi:hypothetical protein
MSVEAPEHESLFQRVEKLVRVCHSFEATLQKLFDDACTALEQGGDGTGVYEQAVEAHERMKTLSSKCDALRDAVSGGSATGAEEPAAGKGRGRSRAVAKRRRRRPAFVYAHCAALLMMRQLQEIKKLQSRANEVQLLFQVEKK